MEIDTVLVKVASRCNINCSYCYVYNMGDDGWRDMPSLISPDTVAILCQSLADLSRDQNRPFAIVLHGGEPLMMGARRLEHLLHSLRSALPGSHRLCMQTNGMLLSQSILDICATYEVSISVSIDGPKLVNDRFRIDKRGRGTYEKVIAGIQLLREHPAAEVLFSGLLSVIDPTSDPRVIYSHLKGLGAPSIDFLYRDGNHSNLPFGKESFESIEYAMWLSGLLDAYLADPSPPRIRFLDDLIKLCLGGRGIKEGLGENDYGIAIVETDGTISKNDTLKSSFGGADKFKNTWSIRTHRLSDIIDAEEFESYHAMQRPTSSICKGCPQLQICGGGMPLHRWKDGNDFDNPSVYCRDQKYIITRITERLMAAGLIS